jgi:phosphoserine aminotransferase
VTKKKLSIVFIAFFVRHFSAGPYFTARSFEKSAQAILDFNDSGLSILEISHQ